MHGYGHKMLQLLQLLVKLTYRTRFSNARRHLSSLMVAGVYVSVRKVIYSPRVVSTNVVIYCGILQDSLQDHTSPHSEVWQSGA